MDLAIRKAGKACVLTLQGSVRADDNQQFEDALKDRQLRETSGVVLDVTKLEYMNSRAIGMVMALWMELSGLGAKLLVVHPTPLVERLLKSVGMYNFVPVTASVAEALKSISEKG